MSDVTANSLIKGQFLVIFRVFKDFPAFLKFFFTISTAIGRQKEGHLIWKDLEASLRCCTIPSNSKRIVQQYIPTSDNQIENPTPIKKRIKTAQSPGRPSSRTIWKTGVFFWDTLYFQLGMSWQTVPRQQHQDRYTSQEDDKTALRLVQELLYCARRNRKDNCF